MKTLYAVMIPWNHGGETMKCIESFHTKEEAVKYRDDVNGWEIIKIPLPQERI